jgi:hypothetical protein
MKLGLVVGTRLPPGGSVSIATAATEPAGSGSETTTNPRASGMKVTLGATLFAPGASVQAW